MKKNLLFFVILFPFFGLSAAAITMATWTSNADPYPPLYSIYNGTAWEAPNTISSLSIPVYDVTNACDPETGTVVATWVDYTSGDTGSPYYAIYRNGAWSEEGVITPDINAYYDVDVIFNPVAKVFVAVWSDPDSSYTLRSSFYDGSSWSSPIAIPDSAVYVVPFAAANTTNGTIVAGWVDNDTRSIMASVYENGSWGTPMEIFDQAGNGDVFMVYDPLRKVMMATWANAGESSHPYYATFDGTVWSTPNPISEASTVSDDVFTTFDETTGAIIATWKDDDDNIPHSSIFNGAGWSTPTTITGSPNVYYDVSVGYNPSLQKTVATWGADNKPFYSLFDGTSSWSNSDTINDESSVYANVICYVTSNPIYVKPPAALSGSRKRNNFGTFCEYYNTLQWTQSSDQGVVSYRIYRNGTVIETVPSNRNSYAQHNQPKNSRATYSVSAVNQYGIESPALTISLP